MLLHSIASQDDIITIEVNRFYAPKIFISLLIFMYLVTLRIFVYVKFSTDPFFDLIQGSHITLFY